MALYVSIAAQSTASSAFISATGPGRGLMVHVPSHAPIGVQADFATQSGATDYGPPMSPDGSGLMRTAVWSGQGPGWGFVAYPPTGFFRLAVNTQTTAAMSFTVLPVVR